MKRPKTERVSSRREGITIMSYGVYLVINTGGPEPAEVTDCGNMTSNVAPVWRAAGCDLAEFDGKQAKDCIRKLTYGLDTLQLNPRSFDQYVRGNGSWGKVEDAVQYLDVLLREFRKHPLATVRVSR